jgi:hypothetical protein
LVITIGDLVPDDVLEQLNEEAVFQVVANIAEGARHEWIRLAGERLKTSRRDYIGSIQPVVHRPGVAVITLVGQPANLIEHGSPEVDLRDWLLGPNVPEAPFGQKGKRRAKAGHFYRAVPFRHGVPGTGGAVGQAMGDPYSGVVKDAGALGRAVYGQAKSLKPGEALPAHMRYRRGKKVVPKLRKHHKTDIYAGMRRLRAAYQVAVQSQYTTFRTISENVGPVQGTDKSGSPALVGWIRPRTEGIKLVPQVQAYIAKVTPASFQAYVGQLGGS